MRIVEGYSADHIDNYFDKSKKIIDEEIFRYAHLTELRKKKYLLRSYLAKIENTLTEEVEDFVDENDISYNDILNSYNIVNEKVNVYEQELEKSDREMENIINYNIFNDLPGVMRVNYKEYECEFNFHDFKCNKKNKWKLKILG